MVEISGPLTTTEKRYFRLLVGRTVTLASLAGVVAVLATRGTADLWVLSVAAYLGLLVGLAVVTYCAFERLEGVAAAVALTVVCLPAGLLLVVLSMDPFAIGVIGLPAWVHKSGKRTQRSTNH